MTDRDIGALAETPTVPQTFHQLGVLVLDGSGSMSELVEGRISKAQAVNVAVRELLTRLIASSERKNFSIAVITFDDHSTVRTPPTRVYDDDGLSIDDNADYDPMQEHGGGTRLDLALREAQSLVEDFLADGRAGEVPRSATIVIMSDGMSTGDPLMVASDIKGNPAVTIWAALFAIIGDTRPEAQQAKETLQQIVSGPTSYKTVYDPETLRKFFVASVSAGTNVRIE